MALPSPPTRLVAGKVWENIAIRTKKLEPQAFSLVGTGEGARDTKALSFSL